MMKKILASLMAVLLCFGALVFVVAAAEEPTEPEKPAYTPVEYKIEDLVAAVNAKKGVFRQPTDVFLQPTDVIVLPEAPAAGPETTETEEPADGTVTEEPAQAVLVVEYLPGNGGIPSDKGLDRFVDYAGTGYAIRALGDYTDYSFKETERQTSNAIDFVNENEYAFKQWKIKSIYTGKEFSRIVLEADWEQPVLTGWAGYQTMMRGYIKTIIDYILQYLQDWFLQLGDFLVGSTT